MCTCICMRMVFSMCMCMCMVRSMCMCMFMVRSAPGVCILLMLVRTFFFFACLFWCVRVLVAMMRVRVCVRLCARVGDSVRMRACVVVMVMVCVYAHQHRTYTLGGGGIHSSQQKRKKKKYKLQQHQHARTWWCARAYWIYVAVVTCVCGSLSYSGLWGHWVLCVCVNVSGHLFTG